MRVSLVIQSIFFCLLVHSGFGSVPAAWNGLAGGVLSADGNSIIVVGQRSGTLIRYSVPDLKEMASAKVCGKLLGAALCQTDNTLLVTARDDEWHIIKLDPLSLSELRTRPARAGASSLIVHPWLKEVYVCNRFDDSVTAHDLRTLKELRRYPVLREPICADLGGSGRLLLVGNHLPSGPANIPPVACSVSFIELETGRTSHVKLPDGSTGLQSLKVDPSGKRCLVTHTLGRYHAPAVQVEHGWMNVACISILDIKKRTVLATIILDDVRRGAADPWDLEWSQSGEILAVAHAGTHEVSIIDYQALTARLPTNGSYLEPNLAFMQGIRSRVGIPGKGPRHLVSKGRILYVSSFFSDTISAVDLNLRTVTNSTGSGNHPWSMERKGEQLFHDATLCHQSWQSCATCHPDGRADGLNWDLINDGIGNPKNTKSVVNAHATPPSMSLGARESAEQAVRSGIRRILFAIRPEEEARAIDSYLRTLKPETAPSKERVYGSPRRGSKVFIRAGCVACHSGPLYSDLASYDVGTGGPRDGAQLMFDNPSLLELWRTAPYLHDGSAPTIMDVLTTHNRGDQHGKTKELTPKQLHDLCAYLMAL